MMEPRPTENGATDANQRGAFLDGYLKVVGHPH
jgi:hypothetical protein